MWPILPPKDKVRTVREKYICSSRNLCCAFHLGEHCHLLVEDTPSRDVQSRRSDSMPCSWEVQDNLGKDDRLLLLKRNVSIKSGKTTPASSWRKGKKQNLIRVDTQGGRGAYDCNYNFTHVSSYTQNTKERIHSPIFEDPKDGFERREKCETTQVRSPYLTAFGTISSLYKDSCQFSFEKQRWERLVHACQISDGGCYSQLSIIYLQRGRHHFQRSYLMTGFIAYI